MKTNNEITANNPQTELDQLAMRPFTDAHEITPHLLNKETKKAVRFMNLYKMRYECLG